MIPPLRARLLPGPTFAWLLIIRAEVGLKTGLLSPCCRFANQSFPMAHVRGSRERKATCTVLGTSAPA